MDLSGTTIDDVGVNFVALGSPALPPTITIRLVSTPSGMTFGDAAQGCDVATDGRSAECNLLSGSGARAPGTAAMAAPTSYTAQLPFSDEGPSTAEVSLTVDDLPDGFELTGDSGTITSHSYVRTTVDAALSLDAARSRPAEGNVYTVPGTLALSGPSAAKISTVTYTVTGGTFLDDGTSTTTVSRPADQTSPTFQVVPADIHDPEVSIAVGVAAPYRDTDLTATTPRTADLAPYDISLTSPAAGTDTADAQGDQQFTATLQTDGFPIEAHPLSFALADPAPGDTLVSSSRAGDTVTFMVRSTSTARHPVAFRVTLPDGLDRRGHPEQHDRHGALDAGTSALGARRRRHLGRPHARRRPARPGRHVHPQRTGVRLRPGRGGRRHPHVHRRRRVLRRRPRLHSLRRAPWPTTERRSSTWSPMTRPRSRR